MLKRWSQRALATCLCFGLLMPTNLMAQATPNPADTKNPDEPKKRRFAVLVGVNSFNRGVDPRGISSAPSPFKDLSYALKDVVDLYEVLKNPRKGQFTDLIVVADMEDLDKVKERWPQLADTVDEIQRGPNFRPTKAGVEAALNSVRKMSLSRDEVFIYFSTHGTVLSKPNEAGLVPSSDMVLVMEDTMARGPDKVLFTPPQAVGMKEQGPLTEAAVMAAMDRISARQKLLIKATCHSYYPPGVVPPKDARPSEGKRGGSDFSFDQILSSRQTVVIGTSSPLEYSYEDPVLANEAYSHYFIRALNTVALVDVNGKPMKEFSDVDRDGDGAISLEEAHNTAARAAYFFTLENKESAQTPFRQDWRFLDPPAFILSGTPKHKPKAYLLPYFEGQRGKFIPCGTKKSAACGSRGYRVDGVDYAASEQPIPLEPGFRTIALLDENSKVVAEARMLVREGGVVRPQDIWALESSRHSMWMTTGAAGWLEGESDAPDWSENPYDGSTIKALPWRGAMTRIGVSRTLVSRTRNDQALEIGAQIRFGTDAGCVNYEGQVDKGYCTNSDLQPEDQLNLLYGADALIHFRQSFPLSGIGSIGAGLQVGALRLVSPQWRLKQTMPTFGPHLTLAWSEQGTWWVNLSAEAELVYADLLRGASLETGVHPNDPIPPETGVTLDPHLHFLGQLTLGVQRRF